MRHERRKFLLGAGTAALAAALPRPAVAQLAAAISRGHVSGTDFGLVPTADPADLAGRDDSGPMQEAVNAAAAAGLPLVLSGGFYAVGNVELPSACTVTGVRGATQIVATGDAPAFWAQQRTAITLRDLWFDGTVVGASVDRPGLLHFAGCEAIELDALRLHAGGANGVSLDRTSGRLENLVVHGFADTGIFAVDNAGLSVSRCRIFDCGNGGIRVWARETGGHDGTIVANNDIYDIRTDGGGNGQNGNGINVFRAGGVSVAGNRMRNCAFSAIRLNASSNAIVQANTCLGSGEVAIFSEFEFSGSVIADNVVDGAAQGISMTNFDVGGRLATCTGNIVRNIYPSSAVNPDTTPVGIFAEADAVVSDNIVEGVPGTGIAVGWGPFLRDISVTGNVIRDTDIGIAVSIAEGAGAALVTGNRIAGARRAGIAGMAWDEMVSDDLVRDSARFPQLTVSGNSVG